MTLTWFLSRRLLSVSAAATRLVAARAAETSREAEVSFADGSTFLFHALWLRDACRDASCVEAQSERKLSASPLVTRLPMSVGIKQIHVDEDGQSLRVEWDCGDVERSTFEAGFLRALAPRAGKQLAGAEAPTDRCGIDSWFEFLNGKDDTACPPPSELALWTAAKPAITRVPYAELASGRLQREHLLRAIIDPGVVIVEGMPDDVRLDGTVRHRLHPAPLERPTASTSAAAAASAARLRPTAPPQDLHTSTRPPRDGRSSPSLRRSTWAACRSTRAATTRTGPSRPRRRWPTRT